MERSLSMELVRVTEAAALASARWMGRGKKDEADDAATSAMRDVFDTVPMKGTVVIGEGEMDEAPMLYIGEKLGNGYGPRGRRPWNTAERPGYVYGKNRGRSRSGRLHRY